MVVQKTEYATTMTIQPDFGPGVVSQDDGLTYFTTDVGSLNQGDSINVSLSYLKANDLLSASILPVHAINPLPQNTSLWQTIIGLFKPVWENRSLLISSGLLFAGILLLFLGFWLSIRKSLCGWKRSPKLRPTIPPQKDQYLRNARGLLPRLRQTCPPRRSLLQNLRVKVNSTLNKWKLVAAALPVQTRAIFELDRRMFDLKIFR